MTVLIIVLSVLALLAAVLLSFLTLSVGYDETFSAYIGFLGLKFSLTKEGKEKKEKQPKGEKTEKPQNRLVSKVKSNSLTDNVTLISDTVKDILPILGNLLKHMRVRKFMLDIRIASFDAAKTAIDYGRVCSAVYPTVSLLSSFMDMTVKKVDITSAFGETKSSAKFNLKLKMRVIILLIAAVKLFLVYKNMTEDTQNERKQHKVNN